MSLKNLSVIKKIPKFLREKCKDKRIIQIYKNFKKSLNIKENYILKNKTSNYAQDAHYILGRIYFFQKRYEEAAITLAEYNAKYFNDYRFNEITLLLSKAATFFAPKEQLCDILKQSLDFTFNPNQETEKKTTNIGMAAKPFRR